MVRRIKKSEHLIVPNIKRKKYYSYKGEISPEVENIIKQDFHVNRSNEKWMTDITEFHISAGKIYLSPIIDCLDGLPVSCTIGTSPAVELVNAMHDKSILILKENERPIIHTDYVEENTMLKFSYITIFKGLFCRIFCIPSSQR